MSSKKKVLGLGLAVLVVLIISGSYLSSVNIPLLQPRGIVADKEFRLLLSVTGIMCIVVIPVFILLGYIVWKYRDTNNSKKKYLPDWDSNRYIEGLWWIIPSIIIFILSIITWNATYALNPFNPLASTEKALNIQVIALDWKWLFIYPSEKVASINKLVIPVNRPVHFYLTSDAPMNSFWIPQLSGQIYSMPGMQTQLYIMANREGHYRGWSANISGIGFASMTFDTAVTSDINFNHWAHQVDKTAPKLTNAAYSVLSRPSSYVAPKYYSHPQPNLFNDTISKYMVPGKQGMVM